MISCSKATAWKWFSLYIRLRDASLDGYVRCCTCSSIKHFKQIQAGHYYSQGAYRRLIFEEKNCHPQCVACNHYKSGNLIKYSEFMAKKYGVEIFDWLKIKNTTNPRGYDFKSISDFYRHKSQELLIKINSDVL